MDEEMFEQQILPAADAYFARHLQSAGWQKLGRNERLGALTLAYALIAELLGEGPDAADSAQRTALFEQALYLAGNYHDGAIRSRTKSESVTGLGSVAYQTAAGAQDDRLEYSPVALRLLAGLLTGTRIARG